MGRITKAQLEEKLAAAETQLAEKDEEIAEAKRQAGNAHPIPTTVDKIAKGENMTEDGGSHAIDHMTILDNHEQPDTNRMPSEEIAAREAGDLSFWGGSWTWAMARNAYGNKPEDKWFINPTSKLVNEVFSSLGSVFGACEVALVAGGHMDELERERERHTEFLRMGDSGEIVSQSLDMLKAYQSRFIECTQRYLGQVASYKTTLEREPTSEHEAAEWRERLADQKIKRDNAGNLCRLWAAHIIAITEAYHSVISDDRAYNLSYNFSPEEGTREHSLLRYTTQQTLNQIGRRMARSVKSGQLDAERFRIPRPWLEASRLKTQISADELIGDMA